MKSFFGVCVFAFVVPVCAMDYFQEIAKTVVQLSDDKNIVINCRNFLAKYNHTLEAESVIIDAVFEKDCATRLKARNDITNFDKIHVAARFNAVGWLNNLLGADSKVNFKMLNLCDEYASTPLGEAIAYDSNEFALKLLELGVSANATNSVYWFPIHTAIFKKNECLVKELLANGARLEPMNTHVDIIKFAEKVSVPEVVVLLKAARASK